MEQDFRDVFSDGAEYLGSKSKQIRGTKLGDLLDFASGKTGLNQRIAETGQTLNFLTGGNMSKQVGRFAGSRPVRGILRMVPGMAIGFTALDAADIVAGDESLANKGMDSAAMAIGGAIGSLGGPVAGLAGASTGKLISDATQWLLGDKKSPEQRKMEEALAALRGGY